MQEEREIDNLTAPGSPSSLSKMKQFLDDKNTQLFKDDPGTIIFAANALLSLCPANDATSLAPNSVTSKSDSKELLVTPCMKKVVPASSHYKDIKKTGKRAKRKLDANDTFLVSPRKLFKNNCVIYPLSNHELLIAPFSSFEFSPALVRSQHSGLVSCSSSLRDGQSVTSSSEFGEDNLSQTNPDFICSPLSHYMGTISLSLEQDEESLSPLHCFMRQFCLEAFTADTEDVSNPRYGRSHGRSIEVGQVGIHCLHCKHLPYSNRPERAVCFPSSLKNIYHSIETWQRRHSLVCHYIPSWIKNKMMELIRLSRSGAGGRRQYWEESARQLGMIDTDRGIRLIRPLNENVTVPKMDSFATEVSLKKTDLKKCTVLLEEDRKLVTEYLYMLLDQMEVCHFADEDRIGGRSKVKDCPIGYPGFQCKHCAGKAGFGRYFPISLHSLTSANSDRNIFNHIMKCRRCPVNVKAELGFHLKQEQGKNRRGSRKLFFRRIWNRMHGSDASDIFVHQVPDA